MNCPKCGKPAEDTTKFCVFCGASLNESRPEDCTTVDVSSGDRKNAGTIVKRMWIISVFAIILIFITHFVGMVPISNKAKSISEERREHISYQNRQYYGHNSKECSKCSNYKEAKENNNQDGAMLWQKTITYCSLIAFAGAMTYGVGTIAEKSTDSKKEQI